MRRPMLLGALGLMAGMIALAACSDSGGEPLEPFFDAEVTGAATTAAEGTAQYGTVTTGGLTGFTLYMEDEDTGLTILLQKPATSRPFVGEYPILPADDIGPVDEYRARVRIVDDVLQQFDGVEGRLIIIESGPTGIRGTMEFDAVRTSPCCDPEPVAITVVGSFTAVPGLVGPLAR